MSNIVEKSVEVAKNRFERGEDTFPVRSNLGFTALLGLSFMGADAKTRLLDESDQAVLHMLRSGGAQAEIYQVYVPDYQGNGRHTTDEMVHVVARGEKPTGAPYDLAEVKNHENAEIRILATTLDTEGDR